MQGIDNEDILIPKVLIMQALSKLVAEEKAEFGSIVRSTNAETLANKTGSVEFIPLTATKNYVLMEKVGDKFEYRGESMTPYNDENDWQLDGKHMRQYRNLTFYVLLTSDIAGDKKIREALEQTGEMPEDGDMLMPCAVSFRSTAYKYGKILATHFKKMDYFGQPAYVKKLKFVPKKETNDKGTWYALNIEEVGKTNPDEKELAQQWINGLLQSKVVVDDTYDEETA